MKKQLLFIAALAASLQMVYAQNSLRKIITGDQGISKHFVTFPDGQQPVFNVSRVNALLDLDPNSNLVLISKFSDQLGQTHYRYYQTYKNIPVENSMYIVNTENDKATGMSGAIVTDFDAQAQQSKTSSSITSQNAINAAIKFAGAKQYMWQDAYMQERIKDLNADTKASYYPTAKLVWYNSGNEINSKNFRLAYKIDVYAEQPLSRAYYFIDAQTGKLLGKKNELFYYTDVTGKANTEYSGEKIVHSSYHPNDSSYHLRDLSRGNGVITLHGDRTNASDYTSKKKIWNLTGQNQHALDVHWGVEKTYDYYMAKFSRNSLDNNGIALTSYVNETSLYDNAFWDGSAMNFGVLSANSNGVTGIDVTGHELTHGVTQYTSALDYSYESGAINESMSDIMGKSVQFFAKSQDINWQLSNDMEWIIRDMSNPKLEGQPDTYQGANWYSGSNDDGGVHTNSGVGNFMFYLLVEGGSGTNDIGSSYTVKGIGIAEADQIIYRTETVYLTPTSQYADWRTACINAATDLYGSASIEAKQVKNAWFAVGIGSSASGVVCNAPTNLSDSAFTNHGAKLFWTGASGATSYNLQWKADTSSTWATIHDIANNSYSLTGLAGCNKYQYQVQTACGTVRNGYSDPVIFSTIGTCNAGSNAYCDSHGDSYYMYIKEVDFNTIHNLSGDNGGYGNYINLSTNVAAGTTVPIVVTAGYPFSEYGLWWTVYIDYNRNGNFNDPGEQALTPVYSESLNPVSLNIAIPSTAKNGSARMRVQMSYYGAEGSCGTIIYGEVEDYTIKITGGTGFNSIAADNSVSASKTMIATPDDKIVNFALSPNPVKGSNALAKYHLISDGKVNMKVIDLSGRIIQNIDLGYQKAGNYTSSVNNLRNLASGNYIIILEQNNIVISHLHFVIAK